MSDDSEATIRYSMEDGGDPPIPPPSTAPAAPPPPPPATEGLGGAAASGGAEGWGPLGMPPMEGAEEDPHLLQRREEIN